MLCIESLDLSIINIILLAFLGGVVGIVSTIGGIGGGPLVMPIFLLVFQFEPNFAKGTSIFMISISSAIATLTHYRHKKIYLPTLLLLALVATLGSLTYFILLPFILVDPLVFYYIFGVFEIVIALRYFWKVIVLFQEDHFAKMNKLPLPSEIKILATKNEKILADIPQETSPLADKAPIVQDPFMISYSIYKKSPKRLLATLPLFFLAGFIASFLGIGGGPINTPVFYEILKLPLHNATAASSTVIFFNSIYNVFSYGLRGEVDWVVGVIMGGGMMYGSFIGAKYASKVSRSWTLFILSSLMLLAGIKMILG